MIVIVCLATTFQLFITILFFCTRAASVADCTSTTQIFTALCYHALSSIDRKFSTGIARLHCGCVCTVYKRRSNCLSATVQHITNT